MPADFKQALGQQSSKGPAPPSKLTTHQTQIVKALIAAHADDVEVSFTVLIPALRDACDNHHAPVTMPVACDFMVQHAVADSNSGNAELFGKAGMPAYSRMCMSHVAVNIVFSIYQVYFGWFLNHMCG